jgi:hypothetical protein
MRSILLIVCALAGTARAANDRIVLVTTDAGTMTEDGAAIEPLVTELGKRGFEHDGGLAADIDAKISRDGGAMSASQVVEAQRLVEDGYQRFIDGDYPRALASARSALDNYDRAPGQLAREPALRDLRYRALIVAARSSEIDGAGEDAFTFMAEAIRSFPDRAINGAQFDPSVSALYRRVKAELAKQGRASLEVKVDDPAATVFVDEQFVAAGAAQLDHLPPGRYRIYVAKGQSAGRVREVDVAAGANVIVTVAWSIDNAIRTSPSSVILDAGHDANIDQQVVIAARIARMLGARTVVLLSVRPVNGRRSIVGYSIAVESQTRAFAAVQIEPVAPSPDTLAKLAAFLAGEKSAQTDGLITVEPGDHPVVVAHASRPLGARRTSAIILGGLGLASLVGAGVVYVSSQDTYDQSKREPDPSMQDALYDSANRKYKVAQGLAIGGAALAIGAAVLWFTDHGERRDGSLAVVVTPTTEGFAAALTGRF